VFNIHLLTAAEDEFSAAYDWYQNQQSELDNKFYHEISHYLSIIEINLYQFPVKYSEEFRSASINTFPFLIIYWIDEINQTVLVALIFYTSRDPKYF